MKKLLFFVTFLFITKLHAIECFSEGNKYTLSLMKNEKGEIDTIELKRLSAKPFPDKVILNEKIIKERKDSDGNAFFEISAGDPGLRQDPDRPQLHIYLKQDIFSLKLFDKSKIPSLKQEKNPRDLNCVPRSLGHLGDFLKSLIPSGISDSTTTREIPIIRSSKQ